jgi:hypothetical protein
VRRRPGPWRGTEVVRNGGRATLRLLPFNDQTPLYSSLNDQWEISYLLGYSADGKVVMKELRLFPRRKSVQDQSAPVPQGGITTDLLRSVKVGAELRYGRAVLRTQSLAPTPPKKAGKRGRPRADRARLLKRYRQLYAARAANPENQLAIEEDMTPSALRTALTRCRQRGEL